MTQPFVPPHVQHLDVYQPGKPIEELERELGITGALKVASNENPCGPSPKALAALPGALPELHLYPDAGGFALRRALADKYGLELAQLALGNGSNDLLYQLVLATCEPTDEVLTHRFAFLSYRLAAQVAGRTFVAATVTPELACDVDALIAAITQRTKLVVIGTPNNPTGSIVTRGGMAKILAALPARALLVIDEAYAEYAAEWPEVDHADGLALLRTDRRVVVLRTFSKIYGLAGLRVGFAAADPSVVDVLGRVGRTFHVSSLAQVGAIAALDDDEHVATSARQARIAIERLRAEVRGPGVRVYPSLANFVLIDCGRASGPIYDGLLRRGVIVRPMAAWGMPDHIRVSVACEADMPRVITTLNEIFAA
ncbi:MAG: histidinol-phosphate transaminase [Deltaproteobacteria bacterium]|nr:histidinol-phosphate transaminase [Deltaproteobacteria bacterium]MDQ3298840.1 histidinol-phosphate transaminase [Myxococcota bacterium]